MTTATDSPPSSPDGAGQVARPKPVGAVSYPGLGRKLIGDGDATPGRLSDHLGRPLVFSAREISPREDNPLWPHERLGEWLFWWTLRAGLNDALRRAGV